MKLPSPHPVDWSLYLVTDPGFLPTEDVVGHILKAVDGGVSVVQLRDKQASDRELEAQALALQQALPEQVPLFINDRVDLALRLGLHLHIGQDDMPYPQARQLLPEELMIGLSINHRSQLDSCLATCRQAGVRPPDVLGIGPMAATPTKPDAAPALGLEGITELANLASAAGIASVAIGGIQASNAAHLASSGVDGICVVSALMGSPTPVQAARQLRNLFEGKST